jgi:hypothetical protein
MPPSPALGTERSRSHHSDQPHEKLENDRQSDRPIRRDYEKGRRSKAIRPPQLINDSKPAPTRLDFSCAYASNAGNGHVGRIALVQCGTVWNPETERYRFFIYEPEHVGPKYPAELAIPIIEDGVFIDLLFINDEMSYTRTTCRAP